MVRSTREAERPVPEPTHGPTRPRRWVIGHLRVLREDHLPRLRHQTWSLAPALVVLGGSGGASGSELGEGGGTCLDCLRTWDLFGFQEQVRKSQEVSGSRRVGFGEIVHSISQDSIHPRL